MGIARGRIPPPTLSNGTQPAPCCLPESAGFAPDPPLLPLPQLSRPPGAKSWLLESMDPGCRGRDRVSSEPHAKAGSGPGSQLSCPHCTPSLTLVIFVSRLVSMGRLPLLMGTVFQPSSATRLPRPPGHKRDRHKVQPGHKQCPVGATHPWQPQVLPSPGTHCWRMARGVLSSCLLT